MPVLKLNPDDETLDRLLEVARCEKRPPDWQAEIMLRQALGLPFPLVGRKPNDSPPEINEINKDAP